jgi:DNA-binding transcriptional MerR regulator
MFKIGDFSRIARVSARLLRFYEEIGLLTPAHTDPQTGYRHYALAQLGDLNRIIVLKELGFSLEQVHDIVRAKVGADELRRMLLLRRNEVTRTLDQEVTRLRQIEARISQLESDGTLSADDVTIRAEPAGRLFSLRRTVPSFAAAMALLAEVRERSRPLAASLRGATLMAVAHSPQFEADEIDVEMGWRMPTNATIIPPGDCGLSVRDLEAVERMAVCVRVGPPDSAHLASAKIGRYLETSGNDLAGPSREVFLRAPDPDRMHESVVEMQYPIQPRRPASDGELPTWVGVR